jgi:PIN domain nuclease of toxin-antitoxin system
MEYLLDTHTFLWFINGDDHLSQKARKCIEDTDAIKYLSIISFWEIAVKISIGKLKLDLPYNELKDHAINSGFEILPVTFEHTSILAGLEFFHRDPFDRMIIAQAITEKLSIISKDANFQHYNVKNIW